MVSSNRLAFTSRSTSRASPSGRVPRLRTARACRRGGQLRLDRTARRPAFRPRARRAGPSAAAFCALVTVSLYSSTVDGSRLVVVL